MSVFVVVDRNGREYDRTSNRNEAEKIARTVGGTVETRDERREMNTPVLATIEKKAKTYVVVRVDGAQSAQQATNVAQDLVFESSKIRSVYPKGVQAVRQATNDGPRFYVRLDKKISTTWTIHDHDEYGQREHTTEILGTELVVTETTVDGEPVALSQAWHCVFSGDRIDPPDYELVDVDETNETYRTIAAARQAGIEYAKTIYDAEAATERAIDRMMDPDDYGDE